MKTYSSKIINALFNGFRQWVDSRFTDTLKNRPEIFVMSQAEYDALVADDGIDENAVYMIREDAQAAAVMSLDASPLAVDSLQSGVTPVDGISTDVVADDIAAQDGQELS